MEKKLYQCPVCGYSSLHEQPRSSSGGGSYEICPSCGFQFGVDDDDKGISHCQWREKWIAEGMHWYSKSIKPPANWSPSNQLSTLPSEK